MQNTRRPAFFTSTGGGGRRMGGSVLSELVLSRAEGVEGLRWVRGGIVGNGCELSRPRQVLGMLPQFKTTSKCKSRRYNRAPKARVGSNERLGATFLQWHFSIHSHSLPNVRTSLFIALRKLSSCRSAARDSSMKSVTMATTKVAKRPKSKSARSKTLSSSCM